MPALKTKTARSIQVGQASAGEAKENFIPLQSLQIALHFWWFIFLLMVIGGLFGFLMHTMRPPVYEAVGRFSASIDFVSTGPMTQFEEDIALEAIGSLLYSSAFLEEVVARAAEAGISTSEAELRAASLLERRVSDWELRVRMADPRRAEQLTNIWVDQGQAALLESYEHALQAEQHRRTLRALEDCLQQAAVSEPVSPLCSRTRIAEIQADLASVGEQYTQALIASRAISPVLRIGMPGRAEVSSRPVIFGRGQLVLAGCLIGFLSGIALLSLGFPARWMKRS